MSPDIQTFYKKQFPDIDDRYMFINLGYNLRPIELQAVMGKIQLKKLDDKNINRIYNFNKIKEAILMDKRNNGLITMPCSQKDSYIAWFGLCMYINSEYETKLEKFKNYLTINSVENTAVILAPSPFCPPTILSGVSSSSKLLPDKYSPKIN